MTTHVSNPPPTSQRVRRTVHRRFGTFGVLSHSTPGQCSEQTLSVASDLPTGPTASLDEPVKGHVFAVRWIQGHAVVPERGWNVHAQRRQRPGASGQRSITRARWNRFA